MKLLKKTFLLFLNWVLTVLLEFILVFHIFVMSFHVLSLKFLILDFFENEKGIDFEYK